MNQPSGFAYLITTIDWIVFFAVLLLTFLVVWYGNNAKNQLSKKDQYSAVELLLMGRRLTLPLFVATLVATWYGGIFGVTQLTFEKGIYNFLTQGVFWYITYLIFAFYLVKKIRQHQVLTLAEYAGDQFGPRAEKLTAVLNFFNLLPMAYIISLGLFLQAIFGGSYIIHCLIGLTLVTAWSLWGGFRAVVFSDVVQFGVMILSVFLVVVFSWVEMGPPTIFQEALPASHLSLTGGESMANILVWGFIALSTLVDPNFYQRCLAADSEKTARRGIIYSTIVWVFFDLCTTVGALYARVAMPEANSQNAYLIHALNMTPPGVRGLILAGILAIILSTLDSYLFNAATCVSYDFFNKKVQFKPWHHHLALIGVAILSLLLSLQFNGNVVEVWKTMGSFSAACLLFPFLCSQLFPRRLSENSFIGAVLTGIIFMILWSVFSLSQYVYGMDKFYAGLFGTSLVMIPALLRGKIQ